MGHTHYWQRPPELPHAHFVAAVADCRKLLPALGIPLAGADGSGTPIFDDDAIVFNGRGEAGYETFASCRDEPPRPDRPLIFSFCKTSHRPYDLAVQCSLIVLKHHLGNNIIVTSDGAEAEWNNARHVCHAILGYGRDFRLDDTGSH